MLSALADSLYIIYQKRLIVKRFSESFLKKFSSKNAHKLLMEGLAAASAAGQLDYIIIHSLGCQHFISVFLTNFEGGIWARCILRTRGSTITKCGCGGVKTPPYRRAGTERLPDKGRYPQGCPSSGPAGPPSPIGEGFIRSNALRDSAQGVAFSAAIRYNVFCINVQRGMNHVR